MQNEGYFLGFTTKIITPLNVLHIVELLLEENSNSVYLYNKNV